MLVGHHSRGKVLQTAEIKVFFQPGDRGEQSDPTETRRGVNTHLFDRIHTATMCQKQEKCRSELHQQNHTGVYPAPSRTGVRFLLVYNDVPRLVDSM